VAEVSASFLVSTAGKWGVNMCDHLSTRSPMIVFVPASQRDQETTSGRLSCACICGGGPNPSGFLFREAPMVLRGDYALLLLHDFTAKQEDRGEESPNFRWTKPNTIHESAVALTIRAAETLATAINSRTPYASSTETVGDIR
jgi:hypothetical protein